VLGRTLAASILIAAFGPMTLSEVGTSFADILTALPVIGAVGLILSANAQHPGRHAMAGLLMGAAVGLKLTNMIFLIGAGASLLYAARPAMALAYFAVGSAIGALGTGGAWCWTLWEQFGNPVFPFYNTIFRSPEAPVAPIADGRFMPLNFWDAAAYPFYWLIGDIHPKGHFEIRGSQFWSCCRRQPRPRA
jgi:O-antigen/teichoic acid export membrane protein